jgi:heme/copper-type cytochrome/quinol oxidase subunit 2
MRQIVLVFIMLMHLPMLIAQRPTHVPGGSEPVDFFETPASIVVYIIIPAIVVVLYIVWRKKIQKEKESHTKNPKENTGENKQ